MATAIDIGTLITRNPEIRGGRPIIAGTGISVRRIAVLYKEGLNAEEIVSQIEHLTLAQVYAALTTAIAPTEIRLKQTWQRIRQSIGG